MASFPSWPRSRHECAGSGDVLLSSAGVKRRLSVFLNPLAPRCADSGSGRRRVSAPILWSSTSSLWSWSAPGVQAL